MREAIAEDALRNLVESNAVRDWRIERYGDKWSLLIQLGGSGSRWIPIRSKREPVRTWASLSSVGAYAESMGVRTITVHL